MPVEEGMIVTFRGDAEPLEGATDKAVKSLTNISTTADKVTRNLNNIPGSSAKAAKALNDTSKSSNTASNALINLSRVAQDAPFGFIGIANNLNPLLESFQRLQAESKATGTSLTTSLLGALTGPAGIGLAIGAISALLTVFQMGLFKSKGETEAVSEALKRLGDSADLAKERLNELKNNLDFSNEFRGLEIQIAGGGDIDILKQKLRNQNNFILDIIDQRKDLQKDISEVTSRLFDFEVGSKERDEIETQLKKLQDTRDDLTRKRGEADGEAMLLQKRIQLQEKKDAEKAAEELKKRLEERRKAWEKYQAGLYKAQQFLKTFQFATPDFSKDVPVIFPRPDYIDEFLNTQRAAIEKGFKAENFFGDLDSVDQLKQRILNKYESVFKSVGQDLPKIIKIGKTEIPLELVFNLPELEKQLMIEAARIEGLMQNLNDHVASTLKEMQVEAIASVGEALAAAASGGDIKNVFSGLFAALGTAMQDLGKALIATAIGLKAIKTAFKTLNPIVAAAAGVALVGLGAVIKNRVSQATPFAQGGLVFGPTLGLIGEGAGTSRRNPEIVAPLNDLKDYLGGAGGTVIVMGKIKGNDILLSNARTSKRNRRGG